MSSSPGKFQFKIKSYDNEEGEYSAWQEAEPGNIIQFIMAHWFNESLPNNLDIIVIKNQKGDQLVIDHENKDVFRFFLIPTGKEWSYYYKMTDIRFMFFTLEHFFSGLLETLQENMNKTMDDWRWVKGDFIGKDFHFKISRWSLVVHFLWPALFLFGFLLYLVFTFVFDFEGLWLFAIVLTILLILNIVQTVRTVKWYLDQKAIEVQLSRGDRFLHVWFYGKKQSIPKTDIQSIKQHFRSDDESYYWIPVFTQIDFVNGDILNLHGLLMPQDIIKEKFFQERDRYHELHSDKRGIQKKTSLTNYFPRASEKRYSR